MKLKVVQKTQGAVCAIPRKPEAIKALLLLAWRKSKNDRPSWLIKEVSSYC